MLILPFELTSDLNNNGKIGGNDATLKTASYKDGASDDDKEKGTEYLFVNDKLSNGLWDNEDTDPNKPASAKEEDDLATFKVTCAATWGAFWFEHPKIDELAFYKSKECKPSDQIAFPLALSATTSLPEKIYVAAEGDFSGQVEGDLVMKFGKADKSETWASDKVKLTIVKGFGDKKFFHAARNYILENNTRFYAGYKQYSSSQTLRIVVMREEACRMKALDTYWRSQPLWGIDEVVGAYSDASVAINANFTFDKQSTGLFRDLTRRCHGRLASGGAYNTNVSSDNDDPNNPSPTDPLRGSVYAGEQAKYIAMPQNNHFTIAKGRVVEFIGESVCLK